MGSVLLSLWIVLIIAALASMTWLVRAELQERATKRRYFDRLTLRASQSRDERTLALVLEALPHVEVAVHEVRWTVSILDDDFSYQPGEVRGSILIASGSISVDASWPMGGVARVQAQIPLQWPAQGSYLAVMANAVAEIRFVGAIPPIKVECGVALDGPGFRDTRGDTRFGAVTAVDPVTEGRRVSEAHYHDLR